MIVIMCLFNGCQEVYDWSQKWCMKLNVSKCKILTLSTNKNSKQNFKYGFQQNNNEFCELEHVDSIVDLGVTIDGDLTFHEHIHGKINKGYEMLGIIKRNFSNLDSGTFLLLYKSLIRS